VVSGSVRLGVPQTGHAGLAVGNPPAISRRGGPTGPLRAPSGQGWRAFWDARATNRGVVAPSDTVGVKGEDVLAVEAELRRAMAALDDVSLFAGEVAGGLTQVEEWLDVGELEFAYADLVTTAEDSKPSPDVWRYLLRAQRRMGLRSEDPYSGRYVQSVEAMSPDEGDARSRPEPPSERASILRGNARIGCLAAASSPFGSMEVRSSPSS